MPINVDLETIIRIARIGTAIFGAFIAALWLALIVWTFRDMRARSRDIFAQLLAALVVVILNVPGYIVYLILRPRETLAEAYERSLEEEALLQAIEERPTCPGCRRAVKHDWQICPHCLTILKRQCKTCNHLMELTWNVCPHCSTPAPKRDSRPLPRDRIKRA